MTVCCFKIHLFYILCSYNRFSREKIFHSNVGRLIFFGWSLFCEFVFSVRTYIDLVCAAWILWSYIILLELSSLEFSFNALKLLQYFSWYFRWLVNFVFQEITKWVYKLWFIHSRLFWRAVFAMILKTDQNCGLWIVCNYDSLFRILLSVKLIWICFGTLWAINLPFIAS